MILAPITGLTKDQLAIIWWPSMVAIGLKFLSAVSIEFKVAHRSVVLNANQSIPFKSVRSVQVNISEIK